MSMKGRCLCSAVEIAIAPPTLLSTHCHCESCRRAHAAAFVTWTAVDESAFRVVKGEDHIRRYESSEGAFRCFCSRCGTSLFTYYTTEHKTFGDEAGRVYIPVAVIVDPLDRLPSSHVSFEEHVPWFDFSDALPRYRAKSEDRIE